MMGNPHFETAPSWKAARTMLEFQPLEPKYTVGHRLQSIRIHVRDHRLRALAVADRTLEAHYGAFVFSQARKGREEARHLALAVSYGPEGRDAQLAGFKSRIYELGSEPPPDDIDGRTPAVVTWSDGAMFHAYPVSSQGRRSWVESPVRPPACIHALSRSPANVDAAAPQAISGTLSSEASGRNRDLGANRIGMQCST